MLSQRQIKKCMKRVNLLMMCPVMVVLWVIVRQTTPEYRPVPNVVVIDKKLIYIHRRNKLLDGCTTQREIRNRETVISYARDSRKKLILCAVPNIVESFQNDLVNVEPKSKKDNNISINGTVSPVKDYRKTKLKVSLDNTENLLTNFRDHTSVILTSDPYWRLYQLYIQEIVVPSGKNVVWQNRFNKTFQYWVKDKEKLCQQMLSFANFIRYVIRSKAKDANLRPISETCSVCEMKYDILGKIETIEDEVARLSKHFNIKTNGISAILSIREVNSYIEDLVNESFVWYHYHADKSCITTLEVAQRIWKAMKLQGIIKNMVQYPSDLLKGEITASKLISKLQEQSYLPYTLYYSAYQNFLAVFKTVPFRNLKAVAELYDRDFLVFDYERYPRQIFEYVGTPRSGEVPATFLT